MSVALEKNNDVRFGEHSTVTINTSSALGGGWTVIYRFWEVVFVKKLLIAKLANIPLSLNEHYLNNVWLRMLAIPPKCVISQSSDKSKSSEVNGTGRKLTSHGFG